MKKILIPVIAFSLSVFLFLFPAMAGGMEWGTLNAGFYIFISTLITFIVTGVTISIVN